MSVVSGGGVDAPPSPSPSDCDGASGGDAKVRLSTIRPQRRFGRRLTLAQNPMVCGSGGDVEDRGSPEVSWSSNGLHEWSSTASPDNLRPRTYGPRFWAMADDC